MEQNKNNTPFTDESVVSIVSLFGYWHLHRVLNGKHYFGHSDHRIGLTICSEQPEKVRDWTSREPLIVQSYTNENGQLVKYNDEPYTSSQIESFKNLTLEELEQWVLRGT